MHTVVQSPPERSLQQRMEALANANDVRTKRAALKRDLKAGRASIIDAIAEPPDYLMGAKVVEIILAVPKYGRVKTGEMLTLARISPTKTIGGLTPGRRSELVELLRGARVAHRPLAVRPIPAAIDAPAPPPPLLGEPTRFQRGVLALAVLDFGEVNRRNAFAAATALRTNPGAITRACDDLKLLGLMDATGRPTDDGRARCSVFPAATAAA
jgi:hypothetical protein